MINLKKLFGCIYTFLILSFISVAQDCQESTAKHYLEVDELKVMFMNGGDMFWNARNPYGQFFVPYQYDPSAVNYRANTMFAGALWLGGYDSGGDLHLAAQTYRNGGTDYWAGPLLASTGLPPTDACSDFDKIWSVKAWMIEEHIADYDADGIINNNTIIDLLKWPGKGNPQFQNLMGFSLPNQDLAPFYDRNSNGLYEPLLGDYPTFEHNNATAIADEIIWSVFNDNGGIHSQSSGGTITGVAPALKAEVQRTAYAFSCTDDSLIGRTLFVKHKIISRNPATLYDVKFGIWSDPDLGCGFDDYIGTIPSANTMYIYNSDNDDNNPCGSQWTQGFGNNPPVQAITILNQPMSHAMHYYNGSREPEKPAEFYNIMSGYFADTTRLTVGGDGYDPTSTNYTNYTFPDNPSLANGWSMTTANLWSADLRIVGTMTKDSLVFGEAFTIDVAYSYHRDLDSNNLQNVNLMEQQIAQVQQFYDNNHPTSTCSRVNYCINNCVYPGDVNTNGIVNDFDYLQIAYQQGENAVPRSKQGDNWLPYTSPNSMNRHIDTDGNGFIDKDDLAVNTTNFGKRNGNYTGLAEGDNTIGDDLYFNQIFDPNPLSFFRSIDSLPDVNGIVLLEMLLGDSTLTGTLHNVRGFTFRVKYDPRVMTLSKNRPGCRFYNYQKYQEGVQIDGNWFDELNTRYDVTSRSVIEEQIGIVHHVSALANDTIRSHGGSVGKLFFNINANPASTDTISSTEVCFFDFMVIDNNYNQIPIGSRCISVVYRDTNHVPDTTNSVTTINTLPIKIYPNPAHSVVHIELGAYEYESIKLYSLLGEELYTVTNQETVVSIPRQQLPAGVYLISIQGSDGTLHSRKVIFD